MTSQSNDSAASNERCKQPQPSATLARPSSKSGKSQALRKSLTKRLLAYATMAGAGAAVCASHADAEVLYTPVYHNVDSLYFLDLNHDGIIDFQITSYYFEGFGSLRVEPKKIRNRIVGERKFCLQNLVGAAALPAGVLIGPNLFDEFPKLGTCMASEAFNTGPWYGVREHYLGLAVEVNGEVHYGWARMSFNNWNCFGCIGRIQGYVYETIPNKPIRAGDEGNAEEASIAPGSLGMLALGAPGLTLWKQAKNDF